MSNQVVTLGYLKEFVNGILTVNSQEKDSYCLTYSDLTGGTIVPKFVDNASPLSITNGVYVNPNFSNSLTYKSNQLVTREHLELKYIQLSSITASSTSTSISCCGGNATLSTNATFNLITKGEGGQSSTQKTQSVSASYSDSASYTTINGNTISFTKNSVTYPNNASSRNSTVKASYTYSGVTKESSVTITQNANTIDANWTTTAQTTNSISVSPSSISFTANGGESAYTVTRNYTQHQVKYDSCDAIVGNNNYTASTTVTPTSFSSNNTSFSVTNSKVSVGAQSSGAAARSATITIGYDGKTTTITANQSANVISDWTASGSPYNISFSVSLASSTGSCGGGTCQATANYTYTQKYIKTDSLGNVTATSAKTTTENVTNSTTWSTSRGSISTSGLLTYPSSNATGTTTTTVTGKYSNNTSNASLTQSSCAEITYGYQLSAASNVSIDKCATSASIAVSGRQITYTNGVASYGSWTTLTNGTHYAISYSSTIEKNETSSAKKYTATISGKGTYASASSITTTITQGAGPCTNVIVFDIISSYDVKEFCLDEPTLICVLECSTNGVYEEPKFLGDNQGNSFGHKYTITYSGVTGTTVSAYITFTETFSTETLLQPKFCHPQQTSGPYFNLTSFSCVICSDCDINTYSLSILPISAITTGDSVSTKVTSKYDCDGCEDCPTTWHAYKYISDTEFDNSNIIQTGNNGDTFSTNEVGKYYIVKSGLLSSGKTFTVVEPIVNGINIANNEPGTAVITCKVGNDIEEFALLDNGANQTFSQEYTANTTININYSANTWTNGESSSGFLVINLQGTNLIVQQNIGNGISFNGSGVDGYRIRAASPNSGSCSGSLVTHNGTYTITINIIFVGNPYSN